MTFLRRISSVFDKRSDENKRPADDDDRWYSPFIARSSTGVYVTPENAIGTAAVYACVTAISETIGSLPLITYSKRDDGGRDRATQSPFYWLFAVQPNDWMTPGEWKEMILVHLLLRGNAYNFKLRDRSGRVLALIPMNPTQMEVIQLDTNELVYRYTLRSGARRDFSSRDVMHFRAGFSDGIVGRSPITVARDPIGLTITMERFAGKFFKNSAKPAGVLTHPAKLDKPSSDRIRKSWQEAHSGEDEAYKVAVVEEGMKFEPITMSGADAQFVDQRRFQLEECARIFRVPPHMVGDLSRATFSNIEHQSINFVIYCLMRYIKRLEETLIINFFTSKIGNKELYAEFLVDGLLRGDNITRNQSYEIMRRNGVISANDWRRLENMPPTSDGAGDQYLVPLNMCPADLLADKLSAESTKSVSNDQKLKEPNTNDNSNDQTERSLAQSALNQCIERLCYKESEAIARIIKKSDSEIKLTEFYEQHEKTCREALQPTVNLYAYIVGKRSGVKVSDEKIEELWLEFWKEYRAKSEVRSGQRALALSGYLCSLLDTKPKSQLLLGES